jgi:hypothetical protein
MRLQVHAVLFGSLVAASLWGKEEGKRTSLFGPNWLSTLISIEVSADGKSGMPNGSRFLVGTPGNHIALATVRHVMFDKSVPGASPADSRQRPDVGVPEPACKRLVCCDFLMKRWV